MANRVYPDLKPRVRSRQRKTAAEGWIGETWYPLDPLTSLGRSYGPPVINHAINEEVTDYPRRQNRLGQNVNGVDKGGPFVLRRHAMIQGGSRYIYTSKGSPRYYISQDTNIASQNFAGFNIDRWLPLPLFDGNLGYWGPMAYKRLKPGGSGKLGQFVAEVTDIPTVPRILDLFRRVDKLRQVGKEFLNYEFGWKPLVNDLITLHDQITLFDDKWRQLVRDHHRLIRRKAVLFDDVIRTYQSGPSPGTWLGKPGVTACYPDFRQNAEVRNVSSVRRQKVWASGRFRLLLPPVSLPGIPEKDFRTWYNALGIVPTPSLIYRITPWTWLIDWVSNVGAIVDNFEGIYIDGAVADWLYVCSHIREDEYQTVTGPWGSGFLHFIREVKERDQASPFGFGLSFHDLTLSQKAILAALGITKMPGGSHGHFYGHR